MSSLVEIGNNLLAELEKIEIEASTTESLRELLYTARETFVLSCATAEEECEILLRLVLLAQRLNGEVPDELRL